MSAAILYESLPPLKATEVRDSVNAALGVFGLSFDLCISAPGELFALTNQVLRIALSADDAPMPPSRLGAALTSRFTRARPFDYASPVAAHRAVVTINVSDDRAQPTEDIPDDTMIVVAHATLSAVLARSLARLVHWHLTDMLYLPQEIPGVRGIGFPVALATRPDLSPARPDARGRPRMSIVAAQSERYFGRPVRVQPTAYPVPDCLAVIDFCIMRKLCGENLLIDGTLFALPGGIEVAVTALQPEPGFPAGLIGLTIRAPLPGLRESPADDGAFITRPAAIAPVARLSAKPRSADGRAP